MNALELFLLVESTRKVLVVDDDDGICDCIKDLLNYEGIDSVCVGSGAAALDALKYEKIDYVLMDGFIGAENGIVITQKIKDKHPDQKIILFSGSNVPEKYHSLFYKIIPKTHIEDLRRVF